MFYIIGIFSIIIVFALIFLFFATVRVDVTANKNKDKYTFNVNTSIGIGSLRYNSSNKPPSNFTFIPKGYTKEFDADFYLNNIKLLFSGGSGSFSKMKQYYFVNKKGILYLMKKTKTYDVILDLKFGLDDASSTAISYGLFSTFLTNLIAAAKRMTMIDIKEINIIPIFNETVLEFDFACIIEAKIGNIIIALKSVKKKKRSVAFGTAHPSVNENNS